MVKAAGSETASDVAVRRQRERGIGADIAFVLGKV